MDHPLGYDANSTDVSKVSSSTKSSTRSNFSLIHSASLSGGNLNRYGSRASSSASNKAASFHINNSSGSTVNNSHSIQHMTPTSRKMNRAQTGRTLKKQEWDSRFAYSAKDEIKANKIRNEEQEDDVSYIVETIETSMDNLNMEHYNKDPGFDFDTFSDYNEFENYRADHGQIEDKDIEWSEFNLDNLIQEFSDLPDFLAAKRHLRRLWEVLSIPLSYQIEFEQEFFADDTITNRTFVFSEITTIESLRDKLRVALLWLLDKDDQEIEENIRVWQEIVDTFREDYEYMYRTEFFVFRNRDLFSLLDTCHLAHEETAEEEAFDTYNPYHPEEAYHPEDPSSNHPPPADSRRLSF